MPLLTNVTLNHNNLEDCGIMQDPNQARLSTQARPCTRQPEGRLARLARPAQGDCSVLLALASRSNWNLFAAGAPWAGAGGGAFCGEAPAAPWPGLSCSLPGGQAGGAAATQPYFLGSWSLWCRWEGCAPAGCVPASLGGSRPPGRGDASGAVLSS